MELTPLPSGAHIHVHMYMVTAINIYVCKHCIFNFVRGTGESVYFFNFHLRNHILSGNGK